MGYFVNYTYKKTMYINKIFYNLQGTLQGGNSTDFGHTTIANLDPKVKSIKIFLGKNIFF